MPHRPAMLHRHASIVFGLAIYGGAALALVGLLNTPGLHAQAQSSPVGAGSLAFEVASVKPNTSGGTNGMLRPGPGGRVDAVNMPLRMLITFAYQLQSFRLVGGPNWITTDRFDIVAKLPGTPDSGADPLKDMRDALRALLSDRFKLAVHQETRDLDIYALVLARPGARPSPSLKASTQDCAAAALAARNGGAPAPPAAGEPMFCGMRASPGLIQVGGMPLSQFVGVLAGQAQVGRVVVDRTGLTGGWDFELTFAAAPTVGGAPTDKGTAADPDAASIFTALQEQLGLKLEPAKGPVDVVVIDHIEQPTPD